jgi:hypothetical protein
VDLYDNTDVIPFDKLEEFFTENLVSPSSGAAAAYWVPAWRSVPNEREDKGGPCQRSAGEHHGPAIPSRGVPAWRLRRVIARYGQVWR